MRLGGLVVEKGDYGHRTDLTFYSKDQTKRMALCINPDEDYVTLMYKLRNVFLWVENLYIEENNTIK